MTWFFTELDPRAKIAGSRDPLGLQQHWTALGRDLVGSLNTVTRSLRGFTTLLLGTYLAEELIRDGRPEEERANFFIRFEQLAGYARVLGHKVSPLGTERIGKRLSEGGGIPIGTGSEAMILADQRTYGLWGLYSTAARGSGLLESYAQRPTTPASEHLRDVVLPRMNAVHPQIWTKVRNLVGGNRSTWYPTRSDQEIIEALAEALSPELLAAEQAFYRRTLVECGESEDPTHGRQRMLWSLMEEVNASGAFEWTFLNRTEVGELARRSTDPGITEALHDILALDPFFALISRLFTLVMQADGTRDQVVEMIRRQEAAFEIDPAALETRRKRFQGGADGLIALARALANRDHAKVLELLLEQNTVVMRSRGGSAWGELRGNRFEVRLRPEPLPAPLDADPDSLFFGYFLPTLKVMGAAVHLGHEV